MIYIDIVTVIMFLVGLSVMSMFYFRRQLLVVLVGLEIVGLVLFLIIMMFFSNFSQPMALPFYVLILGACEARLGLSLFVMVTRLKGSDILRTLRGFRF